MRRARHRDPWSHQQPWTRDLVTIATGSLDFDDVDACHEDVVRQPYVRKTAAIIDRVCDRA
ncbi:hypothetical protein ACETU7_00100 [Rhodococcus sp. 3Y1]